MDLSILSPCRAGCYRAALVRNVLQRFDSATTLFEIFLGDSKSSWKEKGEWK